MNSSIISFQSVLRQRLKSLRLGERYKSRRSLRCYSAAASSPDEEEGIYVPRKAVPSPVIFWKFINFKPYFIPSFILWKAECFGRVDVENVFCLVKMEASVASLGFMVR